MTERCRALIRSLTFGCRPTDSAISQLFMKPTLTLFRHVFAAGNSIMPALSRAASFLPMSWCRASLTLLLMASVAAPVRADVLSLDGNGDFVTFPSAGIPGGSASFTVEAWVNPTTIPTGGENGGTMTFWGTESANQANGFRLRGASGVRHFFWANDHDETLTQNILSDTTGPATNGWHHFALTWDGAQTRWYWNGTLLGTPRPHSGINVVAASHRIGSRPAGEFFDGYMDEIRVWNVARSATDIATDFQ